MTSKGPHFPSVTLVGVLNSDAALNIPDFRAEEQVFQLITQVAGRAGRLTSGRGGYPDLSPDNRTIQLAAKQDYLSFYEEEIKNRKALQLPPLHLSCKASFFRNKGRSNRIRRDSFPSKPDQKSILRIQFASRFALRSCQKQRSIPIRFSHPRKQTDAALAAIEKTNERKLPGVSAFVDIDPISTFFKTIQKSLSDLV